VHTTIDSSNRPYSCLWFVSKPKIGYSPFLHDKIPSKIVNNVFGRDVILFVSYSLETYILKNHASILHWQASRWQWHTPPTIMPLVCQRQESIASLSCMMMLSCSSSFGSLLQISLPMQLLFRRSIIVSS
jgi:hypothetical protein